MEKEPIRHKSVENAKQYCISKIIGRLNTKKEMSLVGRTSGINIIRTVQQQVLDQYESNSKVLQERKPSLVKDDSSHNSKSSLIYRMQKF